MILNFDAAQLEWRAVVHLSADKTGIVEISDGLDFHTDNQQKFKLPDRLTAKKFLFRTIYCPYSIADKTAYAFSVDNDFKHVGGRKFWRNAIDRFYDKYQGIYNFHNGLVREATRYGKLTSETGRTYHFELNRKGDWPVSDIVNWPVQGWSADIMSMARVSAYNRLSNNPRILFVNSVHDSIAFDANISVREAVEVSRVMKSVFRDLPDNYRRIYGKEMNVPMDCDAQIGINWLWTHKLKV